MPPPHPTTADAESWKAAYVELRLKLHAHLLTSGGEAIADEYSPIAFLLLASCTPKQRLTLADKVIAFEMRHHIWAPWGVLDPQFREGIRQLKATTVRRCAGCKAVLITMTTGLSKGLRCSQKSDVIPILTACCPATRRESSRRWGRSRSSRLRRTSLKPQGKRVGNW